MIKVNRIDTEKTKTAIDVLAREKAKNGSYNQPEVNTALREIFHGKCYICENKEPSSYQIEHRIPHKGDINLKFDWNNLFWACAHCNNIKGDNFNPMLNCNDIHVDKKIAFRKSGYFGTDEKYYFEAVEEDTEEIKNTISLLNAVYYSQTPQKQIEALNIRRSLRANLAAFKECLRKYDEETDTVEKEDVKALVERELKENSSFAAFKRWIIWDHAEKFPEFVEFLEGICS